MPVAFRAAAAVAATAAAVGLAAALPVTALPMLLMAPVPGTVLTALTHPAAGAAWAAAVGVLAASVIGPTGAVAALGMCAGPALACGTAARNRWRIEAVIAATIGAWTAGVVLTAWAGTGSLEAATASVRQALAQSVDLFLATAREAGTDTPMLEALETDRSRIVDQLVTLLPALIVLLGGGVALTSLLALRTRVRLGSPINLRRWRMPEQTIWVLIASGFGTFLPLDGAWGVAARNVFAILLGCYFCQGLAIVSFYLARFRVPRGFRVAGYALIAFHHLFAGVVLVLGMLDFWANFRRLQSPTASLQSRSGSG